MIEMSDEDYNRFDPDAEYVKDSPCTICGRKSIARIRMYNSIGLRLFAVCEDHMDALKEVVEKITK